MASADTAGDPSGNHLLLNAEPIGQFFNVERFAVAEPLMRKFQDLAVEIIRDVPRNAERTVALRNLLNSLTSTKHALEYRAPGAGSAPETVSR